MPGDGSVLAELRQIIEGNPRCGITSTVYDRGPSKRTQGNKRIGFRGVLQLNPQERQQFVFTGFSYLPDEPETIGVMLKLVKIALDQDRLILVYYQDQSLNRSMIFDPAAFELFGEYETKASERKKRGEQWINLPRQYSCSLRELADGDAEPRTDELPKGTKGSQQDLTEWFDV